MIEEIIGVAGIIASGLLGRVEGYHQGSKIRNIEQLFLRPESTPDSLWCTCEHSMSMHSDKQGTCQEFLYYEGVIRRDQYGHSIRCRCQCFVGDPARALKDVQAKRELDL